MHVACRCEECVFGSTVKFCIWGEDLCCVAGVTECVLVYGGPNRYSSSYCHQHCTPYALDTIVIHFQSLKSLLIKTSN